LEAGLVAACTLIDRNKRVILVDQEPRANLGGQAFWSLGGLFMVNTPEQRRMFIRDSLDLARQDWLGWASFDRSEDQWPRAWADANLNFATFEMRQWFHQLGMRWFPVVGWAERGGELAEEQALYSDGLPARAAGTGWLSEGRKSWYLDPCSHKLTLVWPSFAYDYRHRNGHFRSAGYAAAETA